MRIDGQEMAPQTWAVLTHAEKWLLGGSRAICPDAVGADSDWDYIVLLPPVGSTKHGALYNAMYANGFAEAPPQVYDHKEIPLEEPPSHFLWEREGVDLLLFLKEVDFEKWATATKVCQRLHLTSREDRIMVHRAIKWGKYFEPEKENGDAIHQ